MSVVGRTVTVLSVPQTKALGRWGQLPLEELEELIYTNLIPDVFAKVEEHLTAAILTTFDVLLESLKKTLLTKGRTNIALATALRKFPRYILGEKGQQPEAEGQFHASRSALIRLIKKYSKDLEENFKSYEKKPWLEEKMKDMGESTAHGMKTWRILRHINLSFNVDDLNGPRRKPSVTMPNFTPKVWENGTVIEVCGSKDMKALEALEDTLRKEREEFRIQKTGEDDLSPNHLYYVLGRQLFGAEDSNFPKLVQQIKYGVGQYIINNNTQSQEEEEKFKADRGMNPDEYVRRMLDTKAKFWPDEFFIENACYLFKCNIVLWVLGKQEPFLFAGDPALIDQLKNKRVANMREFYSMALVSQDRVDDLVKNHYVSVIRGQESRTQVPSVADQEKADEEERAHRALNTLKIVPGDKKTWLSIDTNVFLHVQEGAGRKFWEDLEKSDYMKTRKILVPCVVQFELDRHKDCGHEDRERADRARADRARAILAMLATKRASPIWQVQSDIYPGYAMRVAHLHNNARFDNFQVLKYRNVMVIYKRKKI